MSDTTQRRPADYSQRLDLFLAEKRHEPFLWGVNDCCLFACDWLAILTGKDLAENLRGYKSALEGWRLVKSLGGVDQIARDRCKAQGWPEVHPHYARRGDVVTFETKHGAALGVSCGHVGAFAGIGGTVFHPLPSFKTAWRIL